MAGEVKVAAGPAIEVGANINPTVSKLLFDTAKKKKVKAGAVPEDLLFDKAEEAQSLERLRERHETLGKEIENTKQLLKDTEDDFEKKELKARIERFEASREKLAELIKQREEEKDKDKE